MRAFETWTVRSILLGIVATLMCGCLSNDDEWPPTPRSGNGGGDESPVGAPRVLRVGDRVNVRITTHNSADSMESVIDEHGRIPLPYLAPFKVIDKTPSDAAYAIVKEYVDKQIYAANSVVANVMNLSEKDLTDEYFVTGEVRQRGKFPYRPGMTLRQALIAAGDKTDYASSSVVITRQGTKKTFNINRIRSGRERDPVVYPGDVIEVLPTIL